MADSTAYKKKSIINIGKNRFTVNEGTVVRINKTLKLNANSKCTFSYSYTKAKPLSSTKLKCIYDIFTSDESESSRYNNNLQIILNIKYFNSKYDDDSDSDDLTNGKIQTIQIIPYNNREKTGEYEFDEIDCVSNYIKHIDVIISYHDTNVNDYVIINSLKLHSTVIGSDSSVDDAIEDYFENNGLVIPLSPTAPLPPDPTGYPAGTIFRLQ